VIRLGNQKRKGNAYENKIAKRLSETLGVELRRNPGSGNMENWKGDIVAIHDKDRISFPWCIELKNQKTLKIPAWIRQVEEEAQEMSKKPVLIFHLHGTSEEYAVVRLEDWEDRAMEG
jgi:Holliday junction resolvase